ncbi:hypothetical protein ATO7_04600 [Oceanococcus atlanticus]|uniref:Uncharacterized protein n=1 Tax=Oceanococcus atlanticus TaxID=1317117 RepID=A0A1Y1SIV2_9GAMM|nr:hypothetical protein ATO7_04600 [Oceanococcus atlanticus]
MVVRDQHISRIADADQASLTEQHLIRQLGPYRAVHVALLWMENRRCMSPQIRRNRGSLHIPQIALQIHAASRILNQVANRPGQIRRGRFVGTKYERAGLFTDLWGIALQVSMLTPMHNPFVCPFQTWPALTYALAPSMLSAHLDSTP